MFVEQLSREDLIDYITNYELVKYDDYVRSQYDFNAISNYKVSKGKITFRIRDKKFKFTDFDYTTNYVIALYKGVHNGRWLHFMSRKFGNAYKIAFLTFREQEKNSVLEATGKRFDEDTLKYVEGFYSNNAKADEIVDTFRKKFEAMSYEEREEYLKKYGFDFGSSDEKTL